MIRLISHLIFTMQQLHKYLSKTKYLQSKIIRTKDNKVCVEEENLQKIGLAFNRLVLSIPYDNGNIL